MAAEFESEIVGRLQVKKNGADWHGKKFEVAVQIYNAGAGTKLYPHGFVMLTKQQAKQLGKLLLKVSA